MTQTKDAPVVQGNMILGYENFYIGIAGQNVKFDTLDATSEFDFFGGYASQMYGIDYEVGGLYYTYPNYSQEANCADVFVSLKKDFEIAAIGAKFYRGVKTHEYEVSNAWETSLSIPMPLDITFEALYGNYIDVGNYYSVGFLKPLDTRFKASLCYTGINSKLEGADEQSIVAALSVAF